MNIVVKQLKAHKIDESIRKLLYIENAKEYSLEWGMNHILFAPSKRVRPLLVLESNAVFSSIDNDSFILAAAVELIHTYSLVHDDLPCMDNDDLRRGVKTLHTFRDEAYGVLSGDALLTRVFDILGQYSKHEKFNGILKYTGLLSGFKGMIFGQILDMDGEGKKLEIDVIDRINFHKTANLIQLSMLYGAINGNADEDMIKLITDLGKYIGYIFQLTDDILDITSTTETLGKRTGSDDRNEKSSIPRILGLSKTQDILEEYCQKAIEISETLPGNRHFFIELISYLKTREK